MRQGFPVRGNAENAELRIGNLAGRIELVRANGAQVVVDATIHAQGDSARETQQLLQGMKWVRAEDRHGKEEWTLSYPVNDYKGFAYPRPGSKSVEDSWFLRWLTSKASTTARARRRCARLGDKWERMKCCSSGTAAAVFAIGATPAQGLERTEPILFRVAALHIIPPARSHAHSATRSDR